jgi:hypothetical protein
MRVANLQEKFGKITRHWWKRLPGCSNSECKRVRRAWHRISRGTATVRLQGSPYCLNGCFEHALRHCLEQVSSPVLPKPQPSHRVPLGLLMLSHGDLSNEQLRRALESQKLTGTGGIGE